MVLVLMHSMFGLIYIFIMNSYTRYTLKTKKRKIKKTFKSYTIYTITSHQFTQFVRSRPLPLGEGPADTDARVSIKQKALDATHASSPCTTDLLNMNIGDVPNNATV